MSWYLPNQEDENIYARLDADDSERVRPIVVMDAPREKEAEQ